MQEFKRQFKIINLIVELRSWEMMNSRIFAIDEIARHKMDNEAERRLSTIVNSYAMHIFFEEMKSFNPIYKTPLVPQSQQRANHGSTPLEFHLNSSKF